MTAALSPQAFAPSLVHQVAALVALTVLLAAPGYAVLRLLRLRLGDLAGLTVALGLGYALVTPLFLLELSLGLPLVPLAALLALVWLRPGLGQLATLRGWAIDLALPLAAALLALAVTRGDVQATPAGGLAIRVGFDVSDQAFYASVAQELRRSPLTKVENPVFAGLPLPYSIFPAAVTALAARYGALEVLAAAGSTLPAFGLFWSAAAAMAFARLALGAGRRGCLLAGLLTLLGGDLSWLVPSQGPLERARHFFVFNSFSAEALLYNPWALALPLLLGSLIAAREALAGARGATLAGALVGASLCQTKVFAFVCLAAALGLVALVRRRPADLRLALATLLLAAPGLALLLVGSPGGALRFSPFFAVYSLASAHPGLEWLADRLGALARTPGAALPGLLLLSPVWLAGALGTRLLGLGPLVARARREPGGVHAIVAAMALVGTLLALLVVGQPTLLDGLQFFMTALYLLWPYAAVALDGWADSTGWRRPVAAVLVAAALVGPVGYVARRLWPEALTPPDSWDRRRFELSASELAACARLRQEAHAAARVVVPLAAARGGLLPSYVAALADRRVTAAATDIHVAPEAGLRRRALVERLFDTPAPEQAELVLDELAADWVWESAERPLRSRPPSLEVAFEAPGLRLLRRLPRARGAGPTTSPARAGAGDGCGRAARPPARTRGPWRPPSSVSRASQPAGRSRRATASPAARARAPASGWGRSRPRRRSRAGPRCSCARSRG